MFFHAAHSITTRAWKDLRLEGVMSTDNVFLIFKFRDKESVHLILEKGSWMFCGKIVMLQQCHAYFISNKLYISKILIWVRIHGLPFLLWTIRGLNMASSMVGCPLSCDKMTYECFRLSYA